MNLTRDEWVRVVLVVAGVVPAVLSALFIWQWNKPDVRYGTAGAYITTTLALSNLSLRNMGHSDAENVIITASFADPLTSISTDHVATPFDPSTGGIGQKFVMGIIKRIVPDETVNIYFLTEPSSRWSDYKEFI